MMKTKNFTLTDRGELRWEKNWSEEDQRRFVERLQRETGALGGDMDGDDEWMAEARQDSDDKESVGAVSEVEPGTDEG